MGSQYIDWRSNHAWQSIGIDLIIGMPSYICRMLLHLWQAACQA
jgi:hypothetical protein